MDTNDAQSTTHVGTFIHERRVASSRSAKSVAEAVGISQARFSQIENGIRRGQPAVLRKIAVELGIDEEEMYTTYLQDVIEKARTRWNSDVAGAR